MAGSPKKASRAPMLEIGPVEQAAMTLHEAMRLRFLEVCPRQPDAYKGYAAFHRRSNLRNYTVMLLLLLSIFETPLWCNGGGLRLAQSPEELCAAHLPEGELILSGVPLVPVPVGVIIEVTLLCILLWETLARNNLREYFKDPDATGKPPSSTYQRFDDGVVLELVMVLLGLCDSGIYCLHPDATFRIAPLVRFGLAASLPRVRTLVASFLSVLVAISNVGLFLAGVILVFAWVSAMVFDDVQEQDRYGMAVNQGFESFGNSLYTAFVTMTTANLPDVMVPTYLHNPIIFWIWWLPFFLLAVCIFTQVILASVYSTYQDETTATVKADYKARNQGIAATFNIIKDSTKVTKDGQYEDVVRFDVFEQLIMELKTFAPLEIGQDVVKAVFDSLDDDRNGVLTRAEFSEMVDVLEHKFYKTVRDSPIRRRYGHTWVGDWLRCLMDNGKEGEDLGYFIRFPGSAFDKIMNIFLMSNVLWILVQSVFDLNDIAEPDWFQSIDLFYSFVYLVEVGLKLCYWSWGEYWKSWDNRFDFVTTIMLAGTGVAFLIFSFSKSIMKYLNLIRLMRLVRLLKALNNLSSFQMQVQVIEQMMSTCANVAGMNFLAIYLWSAVGVQFFGGQLYESNPRFKGQDLDYFGSHYQTYNFNDMPLGMVTLFFFMIGTWIDPIAAVCIALFERFSLCWFAAGTFMFSFYVASPLLAFNVYTAFSLDVYVKLKEYAEKEEQGETSEMTRNLVKLQEEMARRGYCLQVEESAELTRAKVYRDMFACEDEDSKG